MCAFVGVGALSRLRETKRTPPLFCGEHGGPTRFRAELSHYLGDLTGVAPGRKAPERAAPDSGASGHGLALPPPKEPHLARPLDGGRFSSPGKSL